MRHVLSLVVTACALAMFWGCGEQSPSGSGGGATTGGGAPSASVESVKLTAEQQAYVNQAQQQLAMLKGDSEGLIADLKKKTESPESEKAVTALETALADAQQVVAALSSADGQSFDAKKAAAESKLKELGAKYAEALSKSKLGDIKLPSM